MVVIVTHNIIYYLPRTRSEFDEYRERHRFFDSALFCMPPEHKVRQFCTWILTAQAKYVMS